MNVLSLFSGIGGLDLGLERAGMTVVGQVEIDPWCQRVLAKHWPEVPRHDDVRTAAGWWLGEPRPAVDLICGGFPCQPVSVAGKRLAQADERWLWPAFADTIRQLRPRYALVENVPGLLAAGMGDVLGDLAACGYDAEWDCVPASAVGANHRRDRVWIVAYPQGSDDRVGLARASERSIPEPGSRGVAAHVADTSGERCREGSREFSGMGTAGRGQAVADTAGARCETGPRGAGGAPWDHSRRPRPDRLGSDVADTGSTRPQGRRPAEPRRWPRPADSGWWRTEPDVGRVAHGIPRRVDRLRGLGNAVVPQVAEHIGRLILAP